jgi:hypothetical protein
MTNIIEALDIFNLGEIDSAGKPASSPEMMSMLDNPVIIRNIVDMKQAIDDGYIDYALGKSIIKYGIISYAYGYCDIVNISDERFVQLSIIESWYNTQNIPDGFHSLISDIRHDTLDMLIHLSNKPFVRKYIDTYLTSEGKSRILHDMLAIVRNVESASDEVPFSDEYMEKLIHYRKHIQHEHNLHAKTYMKEYRQFQSSMSGLLDTLLHIDHQHIHNMNAYHIRFWMLSTVVDEAMPALKALAYDDDCHPEDITIDDIRAMKSFFDTMNREHEFSKHIVHDMRKDTELVNKVNINLWIYVFIDAYMSHDISANMMHCAFKCAELSAFTRENMSLNDCLNASATSIRIMTTFRPPIDVDDRILLHAVTMPLDFAIEEAKISILS